jgi:biotin carboxyl carrier protein
MYKVNVNEKHTFELEMDQINWDLVEIQDGYFHILHHKQSYKAAVLEADYEEMSFQIRINNNIYSLSVKDRFDLLAEQLGFSSIRSNKVNEIKAPMPGLVLDIMVEAGQEVKKGEAVLILEAMKMENVIKAAGDGVIKAVRVEKGQAVEKNQVMLELD